MRADLPQSIRQMVSERAGGRCEYCRIPQLATLHKHEPDHILPIQHGGNSQPDNLALACFRCNRYKGPNVGSYDDKPQKLVPFFNPRTQEWDDHFFFENFEIFPKTPEGFGTINIFRVNDGERVLERKSLMEANLW